MRQISSNDTPWIQKRPLGVDKAQIMLSLVYRNLGRIPLKAMAPWQETIAEIWLHRHTIIWWLCRLTPKLSGAPQHYDWHFIHGASART
jgi:hypothetical protein